MIPDTQSRVPSHTLPHINARIEHETQARITEAARTGTIDERLAQLDREWDTERTLQTNFALVALIGLGLGLRNPRWLALTAGASAFMVQHAIQGWCPPLALFRRLGIRDAGEIERERSALLALKDHA
jgi:hypothetical protein